MNIQFVKKSSNSKTGAIPTTTSDRKTCPSSCPFIGANGCYAEAGYYTRMNWDKVSNGERGDLFPTFISNIKKIKAGQLWRHNVSGDLVPDPKDDTKIDSDKLRQLTQANKGKRGFTYTHYSDSKHNIKAIKQANDDGFTVNLSANNIRHAVELSKYKLPVASVVPMDHGNETRVIDGKKFVTCPATYRDNITCETCKLCSVSDRDYIIAFPVHGTRSKNADIIARG